MPGTDKAGQPRPRREWRLPPVKPWERLGEIGESDWKRLQDAAGCADRVFPGVVRDQIEEAVGIFRYRQQQISAGRNQRPVEGLAGNHTALVRALRRAAVEARKGGMIDLADDLAGKAAAVASPSRRRGRPNGSSRSHLVDFLREIGFIYHDGRARTSQTAESFDAFLRCACDVAGVKIRVGDDAWVKLKAEACRGLAPEALKRERTKDNWRKTMDEWEEAYSGERWRSAGKP